jgi:hyperosmotically inducible periplasmic protein
MTRKKKGETSMRYPILGVLLVTAAILTGTACSTRRANGDVDATYKDSVKQALEQADLKDVTVSEDRDKNTITLDGTVHSDEAKSKAGEVAKSAASGRIVANEISVQPVGMESEAKDIASNRDDAIENNYKAMLIAKGLNEEHIRFDAKNGVLTLKGSVRTPPQRTEAQQLAQAVPDVQQVINNLDVKR